MDRHAVLVFPGQRFDDDEQLAFGRQFGEIEETPTLVDQARRRLSDNRVNDISNLGADGQILAADDRRRMFNLGNLLWHSDSSFKATPAQYSMLHARVIPPEGGETEFADMRAAWDALPEKTQGADPRPGRRAFADLLPRPARLRGIHAGGDARCRAGAAAAGAPASGSGRLSLYLSAHIGRIQGWPRPEAMVLIRELTEHATQPRFVYAHQLDGRRPGGVGQPLHHASRPALRGQGSIRATCGG